MPIKITVPKRDSQPPQEQEQPEARVGQPVLEESADARDMEPGRPYQSFVESEARKYWQEISILNGLTKPAEQEIRAAAMPVLVRALRMRPGRKLNPYLNMAHHAVADVVKHVWEQRWTGRPLSDPYASVDYTDALVQLADDADWLAREIQFPDHPSIYYTRDTRTGKLIPRKDSYIRGKYLSEVFGSRLSNDDRIYPNTSPKRGYAYYTLDDRSGTPSVRIHYHVDQGRGWRDFSGVKFYDKALKDLRSANMDIVSLKGPGLSSQERERRIYEIRKSFGLN